MKTTVLITWFAICFSSIMAQSFIPFKGANVMYILNDTSKAEKYKSFTGHLINNGITIEKTMDDFFQLTTAPKVVSGQLKYKMMVVVNDTAIVIRMEFTGLSMASAMMGEATIDWFEWSYVKAKGDYRNAVFNKAYPILQSFGNVQFIKLN